MEYRLVDKKSALARSATAVDYAASDYLEGDTAKFEWLGVEITRSSPSQYFEAAPMYSSFFIMDVLSDVMVECMVFIDVPENVDYAEAMVRVRGLFSESEFGRGKEIKTGAGKCLAGKYVWHDEQGVEASRGRYRVYLNGDTVVLLIISGRGGVSKAQGAVVSACLDTMKFSRPVLKDRSVLKHVDRVYNFEVTRPGSSWSAYYYGPTLTLSHPWSGAHGYAEVYNAADPKTVYQEDKGRLENIGPAQAHDKRA